jgi:hypothetical protein
MAKWFGGRGRRKVTAVRKTARARLALEVLEERSLLSASTLLHHRLSGKLSAPTTVAVSQFTNADGTPGLRVVTSGDADTVRITEDIQAGTTTVVADGQQQVFDHLFAHFDSTAVTRSKRSSENGNPDTDACRVSTRPSAIPCQFVLRATATLCSE